jgi:signal peptidase II
MSSTTNIDPAAAAPSEGERSWQGKSRYFLLSLAVLVADQWTKWLVEVHLSSHAAVEVIPGLLNFTHVRNTGVAFGMFATRGHVLGTWVLTALGVGALVFVAYYFWIAPRRDRFLLAALALILGGAVGNLADRIVQGAVTDFVDFYFGTYHWHTFNVADSAITVGIVVMIAGTFFQRAPRPAAAAPAVDE